jgi:cell division protein FtsW (lipid II flippase)
VVTESPKKHEKSTFLEELRNWKEPTIPQDPDLIKDRITTIIGLTGVLMGLLVHAVTIIKFDDYGKMGNNIRLFFFLAIYFLTMCGLTGLTTFVAVTAPNDNDPAKTLKKSIIWLMMTFFAISVTIPMILFPDSRIFNIPIPMLYFFLVLITVVYEGFTGLKDEQITEIKNEQEIH